MYPWASLFIWAVLQNYSDMAVFCWEMAGETVLSALSGCKLLREMSKLESETETKLSMKELAQRFENMAHDVFGSCYQSSESRSFTLLIRKSPVWGATTCLQMGTAADARLFFSQDGVQSLLSQIWLVLTFFCPFLCYTSLISYREEEDEEQEEEDIPRDDYRTYGATVFSYADIKHLEAAPGDGLSSPVSATIKGEAYGYIPNGPKRPKRPFIVKRWRQFWYAPVTSFMGNVLMYFLFLLLFAYVLLVDFKGPPPAGPAVSEYVLYFWVFTIVCEEIRETFLVGSLSRQRLRLYWQDMWNKCDLTAIILFIAGVICRMFSSWFHAGRALLCVDYMGGSHSGSSHIFAIHRQLGPKIIIVGKMIKDVFFFLFFLGEGFLPALPPHLRTDPGGGDGRGEDVGHAVHRNITLIEGGAEPCRNQYGNWLVVILLVNLPPGHHILLITCLIAHVQGSLHTVPMAACNSPTPLHSYTFNKVQEHSDVYWKFHAALQSL
ncbi:unnamed protein product [Gadus morhua 'NCC']